MAAMPPEEQVRRDLYAKTREDLLKRQLSNAENYDRAILSLSTASLGFSLAFLTKGDPTKIIYGSAYLRWSWWLFIGAIVFTLASYLISQRAIKRQLRLARRYYVENEAKALNEVNWPARWVNWLAYGAGALFFLAIGSTARFVSLNTGGDCMPDKRPSAVNRTEKPSTADRAEKPSTTRRLVDPPEKRGAPIPDLDPIVRPQEQPAPATAKPDSKPQSSLKVEPTSGEIMAARRSLIFKEKVRQVMHPDEPSDPEY